MHSVSEPRGSHTKECGNRKSCDAISLNRILFPVSLREESWVIYFIIFPLARLGEHQQADVLGKTQGQSYGGRRGGTADRRTLLLHRVGHCVSQGNPTAQRTGSRSNLVLLWAAVETHHCWFFVVVFYRINIFETVVKHCA